MIHSLSGGVVKDKIICDLVKVKINDPFLDRQIYWYICNNKDVIVGDVVLVPFGNKEVKATVLRIDKNVNEQASPIPLKRAKEIICKVK